MPTPQDQSIVRKPYVEVLLVLLAAAYEIARSEYPVILTLNTMLLATNPLEFLKLIAAGVDVVVLRLVPEVFRAVPVIAVTADAPEVDPNSPPV